MSAPLGLGKDRAERALSRVWFTRGRFLVSRDSISPGLDGKSDRPTRSKQVAGPRFRRVVDLQCDLSCLVAEVCATDLVPHEVGDTAGLTAPVNHASLIDLID